MLGLAVALFLVVQGVRTVVLGVKLIRRGFQKATTTRLRVAAVVGLLIGALLAVPGLVAMGYIAVKLREVFRP